jgi:hypothetical protein
MAEARKHDLREQQRHLVWGPENDATVLQISFLYNFKQQYGVGAKYT